MKINLRETSIAMLVLFLSNMLKNIAKLKKKNKAKLNLSCYCGLVVPF